ncbi:MAG: carbohydrate binding domain-containing protein, partial [Clostridia bacterium]|nr:carbohydrate binding domain-containing protein [Clostridia bacterium]
MKRIIQKGIACLTAVMVLVLSTGGAITALAIPQIQVLPGAGENLLVNGSFEDPASTAWTFSDTAAITPTAKYSGNYGLRLTRSEIDAKAIFLFTQVALAPNTTYKITGDVRSSAGSDPEIAFDVTSGTATMTKGSLGTKDGNWSHQTFLTVKTGTDYVYGKLTLSIYRGGSAYTDFDNVTMIATGEEWCPTPTGGMVQQTEVLYDDFNDTMLDPDKWLVSEKGWGGANGGLAAANLKLGVEDGRTCVIMESHGDRYEGNVKGVGGMTRRVGSGFATRDYYASGEYEVVCKIDNTLGVCTAFWSFSYIQYEEGDAHFNELVGNIRNTEIDWETPSPMDDGGENDHVSLDNLRTNCWGGKRPGEGGNYSGRGHNTDNGGNIISIADGKWHTLTYKWYSTAEPRTGKPAVVWYIDGKEVDSYDINNEHYNDGLTPEADPNNYEALQKYYDQGINVPYRGARFWLACWFPVKESKLYVVGNKSATTGWAGTPDFDVAHTYIDSVKITPYNDQANDEYGDRENVPNLAWALPNQYPGYAEAKGVMDAPVPVTEINGQNVNVTWNAIPGATSYDVMMDGRAYNTTAPAYAFSNLSVGNHTLQVRAKNSTVTGIWSYEAMVSIGVPTVTAVASGSDIRVTWDPVPGATTYYMEIDNDPIIVEGAYVPFTSGVLNKYLTGKEDGLHMIRVRSEGPKGMSNWSQQKYVLVGNGIALSTPTLSVTKDAANEHNLTFNISPVSGATGYELLDVATGETTSLTSTTYRKTVADGTYTYKVRAVNAIGPSEWSSEVVVRVGQG